jgi:DNA modification methylase
MAESEPVDSPPSSAPGEAQPLRIPPVGDGYTRPARAPVGSTGFAEMPFDAQEDGQDAPPDCVSDVAPEVNVVSAPWTGEGPAPDYYDPDPDTRIYVGDCRAALAGVPEVVNGQCDLVFADPPFNWNRTYDRWNDNLPREDYLSFTFDWIDMCIGAMAPHGRLVINIPDDTAAEIVCYLKGSMSRQPRERLAMTNWCIWHYRFGQNRRDSFILSKVHVLWFARDPENVVWRPDEVLELSDRATIYGDARTLYKSDGMPAGMRVPMDVWYGSFWGRVQGNNKERRPGHNNQLPEVYMERVIRAATDPGMLVLDPFIGSGTTGTVARALGRRSIGAEFSRENARRAFERMVGLGPIRPLGQQRGASTALYSKRANLGVDTARLKVAPPGTQFERVMSRSAQSLPQT